MSQILYKYFLNKTKLDHLVTFGAPEEDPYYEEIPDKDLHFYQRKGAKRKRKLPSYIPKHDLKILNKVKSRAYTLDLQLSLCGLRIGWSAVIGLIPWIGDLIAFYFALQLVKTAKKIEGGLPKSLETEMMANVTFDFGIGLIPIVGDFINVLYKCNSRNFILLEKHLVKKYGNVQNNQQAIGNNTNPSGPAAASTTKANATQGKTTAAREIDQPYNPELPRAQNNIPPTYPGRSVPKRSVDTTEIGNKV
ncbi:uncharacterized protein KGF55_004117 [Candida pseudojiufengensis]|uniref:uncharacterized protein n=1 Tax=Candida pseudojiufengensis TaxID=497109 RepID=UPI0022248370|nr:uncharacterized protein KGF55_004117 [Candida pseudojiufengensis]KAI5961192.1 hypothetical protein KGF55_004117 [Candida pseudojiufengensis]